MVLAQRVCGSFYARCRRLCAVPRIGEELVEFSLIVGRVATLFLRVSILVGNYSGVLLFALCLCFRTCIEVLVREPAFFYVWLRSALKSSIISGRK